MAADVHAAAPEGDSTSLASIVSESSGGRVQRYRSQDGLLLAARIFLPPSPAPDRLPLLCLAGLSRNARDFIAVGEYFSSHTVEPRTVIALDYRGRGLSEADPDWRHYKPVVEAQDALAGAALFGLERAIVVGTSRGGLIAMLLGALRPGLLGGVVLNDIGPVIEGTGLARIKNYLSAWRPAANWDQAVALVRETAEDKFPALSDDEWRMFTQAYFAETRRGLAPQFDRRLVKTIDDVDFTERIPPLWPQFSSLARVPVMAVRGEHSDILSERTLKEMGERHPAFEAVQVPGQGHAPLLMDRPTLARMDAFAQRCDDAGHG